MSGQDLRLELVCHTQLTFLLGHIKQHGVLQKLGPAQRETGVWGSVESDFASLTSEQQLTEGQTLHAACLPYDS